VGRARVPPGRPSVARGVGLASGPLRVPTGRARGGGPQTLVVGGVTVWLALRVHRTAPLRMTWRPELARDMMTFGSKSYLQTLASTLHFRIDQYMIGFLLDPVQVEIGRAHV